MLIFWLLKKNIYVDRSNRSIPEDSRLLFFPINYNYFRFYYWNNQQKTNEKIHKWRNHPLDHHHYWWLNVNDQLTANNFIIRMKNYCCCSLFPLPLAHTHTIGTLSLFFPIFHFWDLKFSNFSPFTHRSLSLCV